MKKKMMFVKKHWKKIIISIAVLFLIFCVIYISKGFIIAIMGLLGITGLIKIDENNDGVIDDLIQKRRKNKEMINEKSKDILNTSYDDVDLSNNESATYIENRINKRKHKKD